MKAQRAMTSFANVPTIVLLYSMMKKRRLPWICNAALEFSDFLHLHFCYKCEDVKLQSAHRGFPERNPNVIGNYLTISDSFTTKYKTRNHAGRAPTGGPRKVLERSLTHPNPPPQSSRTEPEAPHSSEASIFTDKHMCPLHMDRKKEKPTDDHQVIPGNRLLICIKHWDY